MKFGLMLFGDSQYALDRNKYNLVLETARFADIHGFSSIWTPERHFAPLGGLYPNPSVLNAALARETQQVRLQSGSVVLPLHHPMRIAEEWSIVDNLSGGRVGISFASGWSPDNFAFFPEKYQNRREELFVGIETVRKLWQGESIKVKSGNGKLVDISIYPQPIQAELPIWVTAVGNPQTFTRAGQIGANLLTNLFTQSIEELAEKITIYRQARSRYGHDPDTGIVSLMLHTFVGEDVDVVREQIRVPYCKYLKSNSHIFLQGVAQARGYNVELANLSEKDLDNLVSFIFDRFASTSGLIGTAQTCLELIEQLDNVDKPFAFYGHSLGTLIGFELAHFLRQQYGLSPMHLFVGGSQAPHARISKLKTRSSSSEQMLNYLLDISAVPQSILDDQSLFEKLMHIFKADAQLSLSYIYSKKESLDCPISTFGGTDDPVASQEELAQWRQHTSSTFKLQMFPGEHMFLKNSRELLLEAISQELMTYLGKSNN